ncbi:MAG: ATP-dependent 6-phosphofructokinase [Bdellovibrionales bacterium]|nr:ATP-dependent 6-phosphofructokinase [Bdellovibrionales bacterium]
MRIGILTGGGDAPGLNGIIEAATRTLINLGHEALGIRDGFEGIYNRDVVPLTIDAVRGVHAFAGTFVGTSNRSGTEGREEEFIKAYKELGIDGLIVAGGDGTFRCLKGLDHDVKLIGVPKTIDNDLPGTDATFGYDTACSVVSEAVDDLRTTATAHKRIIVVETMGRTAGWIALGGGMASMADAILIPERPVNLNQFKTFLKEKHKSQRGIIVVTSEGVTLEEGVERDMDKSGKSVMVHDYGIGQRLAQWVEKEIDWEARHIVLGHLQRSHPPTTTDRFLTTAMGIVAARLADQNQWGQAAVYKNGQIHPVALESITGEPRNVDPEHRWVKMVQALGIFI